MVPSSKINNLPKEEITADQNHVTNKEQSVNSFENDIETSTELQNIENITENSDNCCIQPDTSDCEHRQEIKNLRKEILTNLIENSTPGSSGLQKNIQDTSSNTIVEIDSETRNKEILYMETKKIKDDKTLQPQEIENNKNSLDKIEIDTSKITKSLENQNMQNNGGQNCPNIDNQDGDTKIEETSINTTLKEEITKLNTEISGLRKKVIEKERIIDSQEKYILMLEKSRR